MTRQKGHNHFLVRKGRDRVSRLEKGRNDDTNPFPPSKKDFSSQTFNLRAYYERPDNRGYRNDLLVGAYNPFLDMVLSLIPRTPVHRYSSDWSMLGTSFGKCDVRRQRTTTISSITGTLEVRY